MQRNQSLPGLAVSLILGTALALPGHAGAQDPAPSPAPGTAIASTTSETEVGQGADTRQAMIDPSRIVTPGNGEQDMVADGRKIFNGTCSHCHGPDAVVSVRRLDLRQLRHRYGDGTETVFHETVTKGRPAKGMPDWSRVFTEDKFRDIYAFLNTIQAE